MSQFDLDSFVAELRQAALQPDAAKRVRALMNEAFSDPAAIREAMAGFSGDDEILFEDDSVSIWYCRFNPQCHVPPHDHQTTATIGVYQGEEKNHFYLSRDGRLEHMSTRRIGAGDVFAIGPDAIHSVESANGEFSYAIHVYLAPLTSIKRSLFDWDSGQAIPFNDDDFARLERRGAG